MNACDFAGDRVWLKQLVDRWFEAGRKKSKPEELTALHESTEKAITILENARMEVAAELFKALIDQFNNHPDWDSELLVEWVVYNVCHEPSLVFDGPYKSLQRLFDAAHKYPPIIEIFDQSLVMNVEKSIYEQELDLDMCPRLTGFAKINSACFTEIENTKRSLPAPKRRLPEHDEICDLIYSKLNSEGLIAMQGASKKDQAIADRILKSRMDDSDLEYLLHLRKSSQHNRSIIDPFLIILINTDKIRLDSCKITNIDGLIELFGREKCAGIIRLDLRSLEPINEVDMSKIVEYFPNITQLALKNHKLPENTIITKQFPLYFKNLPLETLLLQEFNEVIEIQSILEHCLFLKYFIVGESDITDFNFLLKYPLLLGIEFILCHRVTDLSVLEHLRSLKDFKLIMCNGISNLDFLHKCPSISSLVLSFCTSISEISIGALKKSRVEDLHLWSRNITDYNALKDCSIKTFDFLSEQDADFSFFKDLLSLKALRIHKHSKSIVKVLKHCPSLNTLYIDGFNDYHNENVEQINLEELKECKLEILAVTYCPIVGIALKNFRFLRELYLGHLISRKDVGELENSAVTIYSSDCLAWEDWRIWMKKIGFVHAFSVR